MRNLSLPKADSVISLLPDASSSKEADLSRNVLSALDSVPLETMRRYVGTTSCFALLNVY